MTNRQRLLVVVAWAVCFLVGVGVVLAMAPWLGL
jgi:hypothetical protein